MKLRGLVTNFHIPVSVSDLYIPTIGPQTQYSTGIFKQFMGLGTELSYRPARLHSLAELVTWNRFLGSIKV
jgi:hypothetical protein